MTDRPRPPRPPPPDPQVKERGRRGGRGRPKSLSLSLPLLLLSLLLFLLPCRITVYPSSSSPPLLSAGGREGGVLRSERRGGRGREPGGSKRGQKGMGAPVSPPSSQYGTEEENGEASPPPTHSKKWAWRRRRGRTNGPESERRPVLTSTNWGQQQHADIPVFLLTALYLSILRERSLCVIFPLFSHTCPAFASFPKKLLDDSTSSTPRVSCTCGVSTCPPPPRQKYSSPERYERVPLLPPSYRGHGRIIPSGMRAFIERWGTSEAHYA